jgi:uncharacterized RDD family membrane protein YckC
MAERLATSRLAARRQARTGATTLNDRHTGLGARFVAYLLDTLVLFGFTMLFATVAFLHLFLRTDYGNDNASDAAIWTTMAVLMLTVPGWLIFNLGLLLRRRQTIGQYVVGLSIEKEDGGEPGLARLILYNLALHPLLFHPLLSVFWGGFAYVALALSGSEAVVLASFAVALLCLVAPLIGLFYASGNAGRRALHDRIAGIRVVRLQG